MAHRMLNDLTSVLRLLSFTEAATCGRDFALSVGVLALILALPSGSEMRVKDIALRLSPSTGIYRETALHPCVTLIWRLYLFAIYKDVSFLPGNEMTARSIQRPCSPDDASEL